MQSLKKYGLYIIVGLISVVLAGAAVITLFKLKLPQTELPQIPFINQESQTPTIAPTTIPTTTKESQAPQPEETAELSFSIEGNNNGEIQTNLPPLCVDLSANPISGSAPLTVDFTGSGQDQDEKVAFFEFDFGDGKKQVVEKTDAAAQQLTVQEISHTYTKSGIYTATLKVIDNNDAESTIPDICKLEINAGGGGIGGLENQVTLAPTNTPIPTKAPTLTPTSTPRPTQTVQITPTSQVTQEASVPAPYLPEAGGFLPTVIGTGAAVLIILLAILL